MNKLISFILTLFITMGLSAQNKKTVVAYFSASGVTEGVAKRLAKEHNADIGISLDGDADRVIFCDNRGNISWLYV